MIVDYVMGVKDYFPSNRPSKRIFRRGSDAQPRSQATGMARVTVVPSSGWPPAVRSRFASAVDTRSSRRRYLDIG